MMPRNGQTWIALSAGVLMGLTPAPVNAWFLAWFALAPLWILVTTHSKFNASPPHLTRFAKRSRRFFSPEFRIGFTWGFGYNIIALSWITGLHPLTWMGIPWLASVLITLACWLIITLWGALLVGIWAALLAWLDRFSAPRSLSPLLRILIGTALWCILETIWSWSPLEWTFLGYTQSPNNLWILHLGQLSGPMLVTGAIVAFNGLIAEAWAARQIRHSLWQSNVLVGMSLVWLIGLHGVGLALYSRSLGEPAETALKVGIVQGNVPTRIKLFEEGSRLSIDHYTKGYEALVAQGVDAVLTPEGAFPWLWLGSPLRNPFYQTILERQVLAWVGTVNLDQGKLTQSLVTIDGAGKILSDYDKVKLVPLGEYIPFESTLGSFIGRLSPVEATLKPGRFDQQFNTPFGQAIVGICYESAFSELFRQQAASGGQFILTASNNDPYGAAMMAQHHAQDVMRAIETDRWAVRATNTGFSGIVDPHGRTQWLSGFRTYETHAHTIYRRQAQTPYVQWGDRFTPSLSFLAIGGWLIAKWRDRARRPL
jgi:apolipoprotein N-acyltransferase